MNNVFTNLNFIHLLLLCWHAQSYSSPLQPRIGLDGSRRALLSTLIGAPAIFLGCDDISIKAAASEDQVVVAVASADEGLVSADRVGDLLRAVPTFAIVDAAGIPYVVVGEDAKVTGYFFTTYGEANRILKLAKTSADKAIRRAKQEGQFSQDDDDDQDSENPWNTARISSVPLDFAVTMASKSVPGAYFKIAPAEEDINDALVVIGKSSMPEGKVPLFYFEDFVMSKTQNNNGSSQDQKQERPLFFRKAQLIKAWKQENKGAEIPKVQVTELFRVLTKMVEAGGSDQDLKEVVFVAPEESAKKAKECSRAKGDPFQLGQRIVVL